jgi:DNA-binding HxlR family transcriptional regulator
METMTPDRCPVTTALTVIGGKWKPVILFQLRERSLRFGALRRVVPGVTQKMLTQQLRELERDGIIDRKVHFVVPPKVEYSLTEYGRTLRPLLLAMCEWGKKHRARAKGSRALAA